MKYIIKDWAGNEIEFYGEHETFDGAWDAVYKEFEGLSESDFDEQIGEFHVEATHA